MSIDVTALPSELMVAPQPLIGLYGLDTTNNVIHKTIWETFTNAKTDRPPVQYKLLPPNYEYPKTKLKRVSYEWYQPAGILKRNWMLKHLHVLPAVVVIFKDIEWNDPKWNDKQLHCASMVEMTKNALQERNTRVCLVLLQKAAPLPPGEDVMAAERATSLTTACGISSKVLFILPYTEHLSGYINRLESAFLDMALTYYSLMSKRIRSHRDQLTSAHITLKIRYQFKLGFIAELRQDFSTALKHYTQSYSTLDEIRINDNNCLEIKTIGGFLNYKICRLMFKLKIPKDAINHFLSHIEKYKNRTGCKDIIFEHYAWLSTQHTAFAELFCEAIKNGLPALQTQHPGIYFHRAAEYSQKRKESFLQCNLTATEKSPSAINDNVTSLFTEYFGIRTCKTGETMAARQHQVNTIIIENEKAYNHSATIIHLLGQAMAQFKIYKCLRYRKKLAIDMADEYLRNGDFSKALTLYSLMLPDYRQDKWQSLFSDVLLKTMRCSLLSASINDYINCSIEALSLDIKYTQSERVLILENLWKFLQNEPPILQLSINESQNVTELRKIWENAVGKIKMPISVNLDKLSTLINIYGTFEQVEVTNTDTIRLNVILNIHTDVPIKIRHLDVIVTDKTKNFKLRANKYKVYSSVIHIRKEMQTSNRDENEKLILSEELQTFETGLKLEPNMYYRFLFVMDAQQFLENTQLRVMRYEIFLGTTERLSIRMIKLAQYPCKQFHHYNRSRDLYDNITINSICYIIPTFHLDTHSSLGSEPILVNEYYPVVTTVTNPCDIFLQAITVNINVPTQLKNYVFLATDISSSKQKLLSNIQIDIGDLTMHSTSTVTYYVYSLIETTILLQQKISYTMDMVKPKTHTTTAILDDDSSNSMNSSDDSPEQLNNTNLDQIVASSGKTSANATTGVIVLPTGLTAPIQLEVINENCIKKTWNIELKAKCNAEFKFYGHLYTLSKKILKKIYSGENFLFRAVIELQTDIDLEILETYFVCDHNIVQFDYSCKHKKNTNVYKCGDKLEDVIMLRTDLNVNEWITFNDYERNKSESSALFYNRLYNTCKHISSAKTDVDSTTAQSSMGSNFTASGEHITKCLMGKIPTNMTIVSNTIQSSVALATKESNGNVQLAINSMDDSNKLVPSATSLPVNLTQPLQLKMLSNNNSNTKIIYNKTIDALQATGPLRGFLKATIQTIDTSTTQTTTTSSLNLPHETNIILGVYCVKWRRAKHSMSTEENESKFIITGLPMEQPPLNIYCTIEERVFVNMPMIYRIRLKNPTSIIVHLVATLIVQNTDPFICSGHKQLDISILPHAEKELIYNLYPYKVGWHNLPQVILEYNAHVDPTKDEQQNILLAELIQRWMPKKFSYCHL